MASDIFAKIGDIKGESVDTKHKDEIELLSWSWGVSRSASGSGGGGGRGRARRRFNDLSFTHKIDKASPLLLKACATGQHLKEATITRRKAGKGQQEFLVIKMNDVLVTSVADSDDSGGSQMESVTPRVREGGSRVPAAEAQRLSGCRHPFQVRPQGEQGRVSGRRNCPLTTEP